MKTLCRMCSKPKCAYRLGRASHPGKRTGRRALGQQRIYVVYLICRAWYFRQSRPQYQLVCTALVHPGMVQLVSNVFTVRTRIYEFKSGRPQIGIIDSGGWHSTDKVEDENVSINFSPRSPLGTNLIATCVGTRWGIQEENVFARQTRGLQGDHLMLMCEVREGWRRIPET